MGKLNQKKIREISEPGRYSDGDGLYLHRREGGSSQWVLRTVVLGKRRDIGLGSTSTLSLDEARDHAKYLRKMAKLGGDPIGERRQQKAIPTYREAATQVWSINRPTWKNSKHAAQWINTQKTYAFPVFGETRIDQVSSGQILKCLTPIWLEKEETARRLKQRIQTVFDWAKGAGHRSGDSPLEGIERALPRQSYKVKHHSALDWQQAPAFYAELKLRNSGVISALALQLLILTALRSGEVRLAQWSEFNWETKVWIIPDHRMKMKREHRVPLSTEAQNLLKSLPESGSNYVFPGDRLEGPLSNTAMTMLLRRMNMPEITAHGFRSTFRDWVSDNNVAPYEVAEMALAHKVGDKTEKAYARSDLLEQRRILMDRWSKFLTGRN